jgi:two-component sensor histidine kinase
MSVAGQELAAYVGRVTLRGPNVSLAAKVVQPLSMLLHELATNAAKYGALSGQEGRVEVVWLLDTSDDTLHLRWREDGGPPIPHPPTRRGFGTRVIDATAAQLGGTVQRRWQPSGLSCEVRFPLQRILRSERPTHTVDAEHAAAGSAKAVSGHA